MTKNSPKEKAGILGGTFDPVTLGHLSLAQNIRIKMNLDRVWFIPAWQSPHKQDRFDVAVFVGFHCIIGRVYASLPWL